MSKPKAPQLPTAPSFQSDPFYAPAQQDLTTQYRGIFNDFSGLSPMMQDTINTSPDITRLTLEGLSAQLSPYMRTGRQDLINQLESNNQLTGSTTGSTLQNFENDYLSQLTAAGAQAGISDINRALNNRVQLYGMGLNTAQSVAGAGLQNQEQMNQFALQNYQNQVAAALMSQPQQRGGFMGALTGALGGGLSGFAMTGSPIGAGIGAIGGGLAGGFGTPGTGGGLMTAGAGLAGSRYGRTSMPSYSPYTIYNPGTPETIDDKLNAFSPLGLYSNWRN